MRLEDHYADSSLAELLVDAVRRELNEPITAEDLAPIDEFHIRGLKGTQELADLAELNAGEKVLDVGCGIGGPARKLAAGDGCQVTGIDLTPAYIEAAQGLTQLAGLSERVRFHVADALDMPFQDEAFDVCWTEHVAMNIENKAGLYREMFRVTRPGGRLALYDIMAGDGEPDYPTPWASVASQSFLATPAEVRRLVEEAGFEVRVWNDITGVATEWLEEQLQKPRMSLGLHLLMGDRIRGLLENVLRSLQEGRLRVVMAVAERPQ